MSIKSADLWSKIGFLFGCALALALLTADIDSYSSTGQASLPFGLHGQAILFTVMITLGSTFVQVAIWRIRRQRVEYRALVRETVGEVLNEVAKMATVAEAKPEHAPTGGELRANGKVLEIGSRLAKKMVEP